MSPSDPHFLGHRQRLRERFLKTGLAGLADYEVVELLLTLAIPRSDVKQPAKALIARFGSLRGILDARVAEVMAEHDYSQIPVTVEGRIVGSMSEVRLCAVLMQDPGMCAQPVSAVMQAAFPFVDVSTGLTALAGMITADNPAVLVRDFKSRETYIITRADLIRALSGPRA